MRNPSRRPRPRPLRRPTGIRRRPRPGPGALRAHAKSCGLQRLHRCPLPLHPRVQVDLRGLDGVVPEQVAERLEVGAVVLKSLLYHGRRCAGLSGSRASRRAVERVKRSAASAPWAGGCGPGSLDSWFTNHPRAPHDTASPPTLLTPHFGEQRLSSRLKPRSHFQPSPQELSERKACSGTLMD